MHIEKLCLSWGPFFVIIVLYPPAEEIQKELIQEVSKAYFIKEDVEWRKATPICGERQG